VEAGGVAETVLVRGAGGGTDEIRRCRGIRIAYDDEGARADDAVVFLPGWCNSGRSFFALLAERLAARHRVIRPDWRGPGDSGRPGADFGHDEADFGHDELADDAMAVIEAAGVRPASAIQR
jgi:pimeloyl-ACP methyl ester carboxylesterase